MSITGRAGFVFAEIRVNNKGLRDDRAIQQNREVIVQRVGLRLLFIRGVKAAIGCVNAATAPRLYTYDCNEQKVAVVDNRRGT